MILAEFCRCGSLKIRGNCTSKNCTEHKRSLVDEATYSQIDYIKSLAEKLNKGLEIDFSILSKHEASRIIKELSAQLENDI